MEEKVRARRAQKLAEERRRPSITDYAYDARQFIPPAWLQVNPQVYRAHEILHNCACIVMRRISYMAWLKGHCYDFLCAAELGSVWDKHCASVKLLREWQDYNMLFSNPLYRTPCPRQKLNKDVLEFQLDPDRYDAFHKWFSNLLLELVMGPMEEYVLYLYRTESTAAHSLNSYNHQNYIFWWNRYFRPWMHEWEGCIASLVLPSWESVIDDLYIWVIDRVEEPSKLANFLSKCRDKEYAKMMVIDSEEQVNEHQECNPRYSAHIDGLTADTESDVERVFKNTQEGNCTYTDDIDELDEIDEVVMVNEFFRTDSL
ncbi:hypothetical protein N7532_003586 [Penicillium argentinense]|uniref:Uncharacterized protein n=1 Tax=Penicillium argentinense TaxID=1131581 RepID=A0A9W9FN66_9EURO|nr:uncharacterized protein N7532_003586 [Penicillium argentinense]KAJ5103057.1 hypothetical protein N7532_003586 [Penicillium argentinense]